MILKFDFTAVSVLCAVTLFGYGLCARAVDSASLPNPFFATDAGTKDAATTNSALLQFLEDKARQLIAGCRVRADNDTTFFTPDGEGNYRALWTRAFAYMVENAGWRCRILLAR